MKTLIKKFVPVKVVGLLQTLKPSHLFKKTSYSQCGEDLLIDFVLNLLHGNRPKTYLDIGANHPYSLSNTALLYKSGGRGVLVEPDPNLAQLLRNKRPEDNVLQYGVHFSGERNADFYIFDTPTLNTFSKVEMQRYKSMGHQLKKTINVDLKNINDILDISGDLDFMNIDIEGLDKVILEMVDWQKYRPTCVCVETLTYDTTKEPKKLTDIINYMVEQNYFLYADTYVNSIFIDCNQWKLKWE